MAGHVDLVKRISDVARQARLIGFDSPDQEITVHQQPPHQLCDVYTVTSSPVGTNYTVKISNGQSGDVVDAYSGRESVATQTINEISADLCPRIIVADNTYGIVIQEHLAGCETLQERILSQSKVDHGVTCNIARNLAKIHRTTHSLTLGDAKFAEMASTFGNTASTDFMMEQALRIPFAVENLNGPETTRLASSILGQPQFRNDVDAIRQLFVSSKDCLIHGNLNMSSIVVKDGHFIKLVDLGFVQVGPSAYDLGCLVAHYMMAHYIHMMTEQDYSSHRQVAHSMQDSIRKTIDCYLEEQTAYSGTLGQHRSDLMSQVSAFAGLELIRRALDTVSCSQYPLTDHVRHSILQSGHRLISRYNNIDNAGRMLMIGLQLC